MNYPDGLSGWAMCQIEGCLGYGPCSRCGETNYHLMGYIGARKRWAKTWGVSEEETEKRFKTYRASDGKRYEIAKEAEDVAP